MISKEAIQDLVIRLKQKRITLKPINDGHSIGVSGGIGLCIIELQKILDESEDDMEQLDRELIKQYREVTQTLKASEDVPKARRDLHIKTCYSTFEEYVFRPDNYSKHQLEAAVKTAAKVLENDGKEGLC